MWNFCRYVNVSNHGQFFFLFHFASPNLSEHTPGLNFEVLNFTQLLYCPHWSRQTDPTERNGERRQCDLAIVRYRCGVRQGDKVVYFSFFSFSFLNLGGRRGKEALSNVVSITNVI